MLLIRKCITVCLYTEMKFININLNTEMTPLSFKSNSLKNFVIGSNSGHFIQYTRMTSDTLQEEIRYGISTWYSNVHKSRTNQNAANFPKYKNRDLIKYVTNHWFSNIWTTQNDLDGMVHVITDFLYYMTDLLPRLKTSEVFFLVDWISLSTQSKLKICQHMYTVYTYIAHLTYTNHKI